MKTIIKPTTTTFNQKDYMELIGSVSSLEKEIEEKDSKIEKTTNKLKNLLECLDSHFSITELTPEMLDKELICHADRHSPTDKIELRFRIK